VKCVKDVDAQRLARLSNTSWGYVLEALQERYHIFRFQTVTPTGVTQTKQGLHVQVFATLQPYVLSMSTPILVPVRPRLLP
jgi:hypothetical protein